MHRVISFALALVALGCGGGGPVTVSGQVTFDGKPVEDGRITFRQTDGEKKVFSAPIVNGAYSLPIDPGSTLVEITASRIIPGRFDKSNGTLEPVGVMYIPERYNSRTTLKADVTSSNRTFPFELKSKR